MIRAHRTAPRRHRVEGWAQEGPGPGCGPGLRALLRRWSPAHASRGVRGPAGGARVGSAGAGSELGAGRAVALPRALGAAGGSGGQRGTAGRPVPAPRKPGPARQEGEGEGRGWGCGGGRRRTAGRAGALTSWRRTRDAGAGALRCRATGGRGDGGARRSSEPRWVRAGGAGRAFAGTPAPGCRQPRARAPCSPARLRHAGPAAARRRARPGAPSPREPERPRRGSRRRLPAPRF